MTALSVTGFGALRATDSTALELADVLVGRSAVPDGDAPFGGAPIPPVGAHVVEGFDIRERLGRKGTSTLDRCAGLALVACGEALEDSALTVDDTNRRRVGLVLGTTLGSMQSTMDFSAETIVADKPYLVNPALFPNTVMNRAAGQAAIWHGLKGVNATIAGGALAFLHSLRYAVNALERGYADALVVGAVEEFSPATAWAAHLNGRRAAGEGAALFVVERADAARAAARRIDADVLAVVAGFAPRHRGDAQDKSLARCIHRAIARAGITVTDVSTVAVGTASECVDSALADVLGGRTLPHVRVESNFGECGAAAGALAFAGLLAQHRDDPTRDGEFALVVGCTPDGGVAAAVTRGWSRGGADRE